METRNNRRDRIGLPRLATLPILLLLSIVVSPSARASASSREGPRLSARTGGIPIKVSHAPLTQALKALGVKTEHGYIVFGVEVYKKEGKEPIVDLNIPPHTNAEEGLRRIFKQLPEYTFTVVSEHLVSVYPRAAMADRADPLNLRVRCFDVESERAGVILTWPERFIPELKNRTAAALPESGKAHHIDIYVGPVAVGPLVTLHLRDVTVRQILNAVSAATEKSAPKEGTWGWVHSRVPKSPSGKGSVGKWRLFGTMLHNWPEQMHGIS